MKTKHLLFGWMLASLFLFSCRDKEVTRTEEQIEENHPTGPDHTTIETNDSTTVVRDSVTH